MPDIDFPIEFVVAGVPVSHQASARTRRNWMERVKAASVVALPEGHFATDAPIAITLFVFGSILVGGDLDNMIKPILDALSRHVHLDDAQVERIWIQRFDPGQPVDFDRPSPRLIRAARDERPTLYVRIADDLTEGLR